MPAYPPEPWRMAGDASISAWYLPADEAPAVPAGVEPLIVAGRVLVLAAWVRYRAPSPLTYDELLAAVAVRSGRRIAGTITDIWVDSEASLAGGRELWGIQKDMAAFDVNEGRAFTASAATAEDWITTAAFKVRTGLPWAPPSRATIVQAFDGGLKHTPVRVRAKPRPATASWNPNPDGPLGYLAARTPFFSMRMDEFDMTFGVQR